MPQEPHEVLIDAWDCVVRAAFADADELKVLAVRVADRLDAEPRLSAAIKRLAIVEGAGRGLALLVEAAPPGRRGALRRLSAVVSQEIDEMHEIWYDEDGFDADDDDELPA